MSINIYHQQPLNPSGTPVLQDESVCLFEFNDEEVMEGFSTMSRQCSQWAGGAEKKKRGRSEMVSE